MESVMREIESKPPSHSQPHSQGTDVTKAPEALFQARLCGCKSDPECQAKESGVNLTNVLLN